MDHNNSESLYTLNDKELSTVAGGARSVQSSRGNSAFGYSHNDPKEIIELERIAALTPRGT